MKYYLCSLFFASLVLLVACKNKDDDHSQVEVDPVISNVLISKDTIRQGLNPQDDSFVFSFSFINQFGEPGFASENDTIFLTFSDLRFPTVDPFLYYVMPVPNTSLIQISDGNIDVTVNTTCCAVNVDMPCNAEDGVYESLSYEVGYDNSFGYDIPKDTIDLVLDCSF